LHCSPFLPEKRRTLRRRRAQVCAVAQYSNALKACQPGLLRQVYGASKSLIHGLFPTTCLLCLDPGQPPDLDLCRDCEDDLPRNAPACLRCAMPLPRGTAGCSCCGTRPAAFDAAFAPFRYEFPMAELIHRLKYGGQVTIARILGIVLAHRLLERGRPVVDALVPVPLHAAREARRGYNQACEIARFAGSVLGLPVLDRLALRLRATEEQAALPASVRRVNVSGAFEALAGCAPASVAVVDDVLTTGATADALAHALKRAGARHVEAWAVARAAGDPDQR
jgi:ComF family protein